MKLIEKLRTEMPELSQSAKSIHFSFPEPSQSGVIPLQFTAIKAGYDDKTIFSDFTMSVNRGDKIAIVGPNGAGKSTLVKLASGLLKPMAGSVKYGHNVSIRYFGQHQLEQLDPEKTLIKQLFRIL